MRTRWRDRLSRNALYRVAKNIAHQSRQLCERWARHRHAVPALCVVSFLGGSIAPLPSDIMLVPMVMAQPRRWKFLTTVTVASSVMGALFAYALGFWLLAHWMPMLGPDTHAQIENARELISNWGAAALFTAAFLPIPFKILAVAYGAAALSLPAFLLAVTVGRGLRFWLMSKAILKLQGFTQVS